MAIIMSEPNWHRGCTWCWRTIWHMTTPGTVDWRSVAARVFKADGHCNLLTTPERDALLVAVAEVPIDPTMPLRDAMEHGNPGAIVGAVVAGAALADHVHPYVD